MAIVRDMGILLVGAATGWIIGKVGGRSPEDLPRLTGRLTQEERSPYGPFGTADEDESSWDLSIKGRKVGSISQARDDRWAWRGHREGFTSPPLETETQAREWVRRPWSE